MSLEIAAVELAEILIARGLSPESSHDAVREILEKLGRRLTEDATQETMSPDDPEFGLNVGMVLLCLVCAAAASGLTQGLLNLDTMEMKIKSQSGSPKEKRNAARVLPVISRHHLLLVTLMLWNATAMEALPLFLDKLVPEWLAIVLSVCLVLIVCEIIPAAILTGPKQLELASALVPLVYCVMGLFFVVAYPISVVLDHIIGHEEGITTYNRREMATLVRLQHEEGTRQGSHAMDGVTSRHTHHMDNEEVAIIEGALTFRNIKVDQVMTPISEAFMLEAHERLNYKTLAEIFKAGYSRIPIYDKNRNDVIGLILVKDLIFVDPADDTPIRNFVQLFGRHPTEVYNDDSLGETLNNFRQQSSHLALVREVVDNGAADATYKNVGIVTLEDIIEIILGTEIEDEHDADDERHHNKKLRDFDLARLRLLNSKMSDNSALGEEEVRAVAAHLLANVKQVQKLFRDDMDSVRELVRRGMLVELKRKSDNTIKPEPEDIIYRRGVPTTFCTLILNGKITVVAGRDEFSVDMGPWSILAADSLISGDAQYSPDFVAHVSSESVRAVRLSIYSDFGRSSRESAGGERLPASVFPALDRRKQELGLVEMREHTQYKKMVQLPVRVSAESGQEGSGAAGGAASGRSISPANRGSLGNGYSNGSNSAAVAMSYSALPVTVAGEGGTGTGTGSGSGSGSGSTRRALQASRPLTGGALSGSVRAAREQQQQQQQQQQQLQQLLPPPVLVKAIPVPPITGREISPAPWAKERESEVGTAKPERSPEPGPADRV